MSHRGEVREWTLNPLWTKLDREAHADFGLLRLFLVSQASGWRLPISLDRRSGKASQKPLAAALGEAKRGPTRTIVS